MASFSFKTYLSSSSISSVSNKQQELIAAHDYMVRYHGKLKEVSGILCNSGNPLECLIKVDALEHLAIDYHFKDEIQAILSSQYKSFTAGGAISFDGDYNLYNVSLCFRLLRQNGYHVSLDVFNRFLDKDGKFKEALCSDFKGMMGLYQASQLGTEGEDLLDQAIAFTSMHLSDSMGIFDQDVACLIKYGLDNPYHKSLARFNVKHYVEHFEKIYGIDGIFKEVAAMDFNIVQTLQQKEFEQFSMWWSDVGLAQKLEFARDQPLKWYMWSLSMLSEPMLSMQRIELTKTISLIYVMDDIFDVYGKLNELVRLNEAINKWEISEVEQLPYCMKHFFKALYDITEEISNLILKEYGWNPIDSLRKTWSSLCNAFLVEAKWLSLGNLPGAEDYLKNAVVSSGVHVVMIHAFVLLGQGINKEGVDLVDSIPGVISSPAMILRLWDDSGSAKDENQDGFDGSYIECYMKEHRSSLESAQQHVVQMISNEWKKLNKECLSSHPFPATFRKVSLNTARMVEMMYSYDENRKLPILAQHTKSMLYEKIHLHN